MNILNSHILRYHKVQIGVRKIPDGVNAVFDQHLAYLNGVFLWESQRRDFDIILPEKGWNLVRHTDWNTPDDLAL